LRIVRVDDGYDRLTDSPKIIPTPTHNGAKQRHLPILEVSQHTNIRAEGPCPAANGSRARSGDSDDESGWLMRCDPPCSATIR
jgi:hypothetical protein